METINNERCYHRRTGRRDFRAAAWLLAQRIRLFTMTDNLTDSQIGKSCRLMVRGVNCRAISENSRSCRELRKPRNFGLEPVPLNG